jgi:hypothetical protein
MTTPTLVTIQVGQPRALGAEGAADPLDRPWTSGICKGSVAGPLRLGRTNLAGDGQADLKAHGGRRRPSASTRPTTIPPGGGSCPGSTSPTGRSGRTSPSGG